ncbi:MAG: hypothetical protein ACI9AP_001095, partial [Flavobacteriales bacterium]
SMVFVLVMLNFLIEYVNIPNLFELHAITRRTASRLCRNIFTLIT